MFLYLMGCINTASVAQKDIPEMISGVLGSMFLTIFLFARHQTIKCAIVDVKNITASTIMNSSFMSIS